jgi:hypothetical protein
MPFLMRLIGEMLLVFLLRITMLLAVIVAARWIDDEKARYFVIGYYVAIHRDLVLWVGRRLGIVEKTTPKA